MSQGLSDEEMDRVFELLDGGGGGSEDGSGLGLGLEGEADLAGMSDLLRDLLAMSDTGSFDPRLLAQLPEEDFMMLAGMLESMFGRGGADAVREQIGNLLPGGGGPRPGGGGRPLSGEGRPEAGERPGTGDRRDPDVPADQRIPRRRSDRQERPDRGSR